MPTATKTGHTALPLFIRDAGKFGLSDSRLLNIEHESGELRSVVATLNESQICEEHGSVEVYAELIVRAVNHHAELVAALRYLQAMPNDPRAHRAALDILAKL